MEERPINIYEYFYDSKNRPVVTMCTTMHLNGKCTRGVSICGIPDIKNGTFCKARGRIIARNRSFQAFGQEKSSGIIKSDRALLIYEDAVDWIEYGTFFKSQYNIALTVAQKLKIKDILLRWKEMKGETYVD